MSRPPIDVLQRSERARALAAEYRAAVRDTNYYREHMHGTLPVPAEALKELAERACLCRLDERDRERRALHKAIFEEPSEGLVEEFAQRRRSFALFLALLDRDPEVASDDWAFRQAAIDAFKDDGWQHGERARAVAGWAALAMKECLQDALSSVWHDLCRSALARQPPDGYSGAQLAGMIRDTLAEARSLQLPEGLLDVRPDDPTAQVRTRLVAALRDTSWAELADWAADDDSALGGLAALLVIADRLPSVDAGETAGWARIATQVSAHQTGLLPLLTALTIHLGDSPTVADTLEWLTRVAIIRPHETIAYSKLPDFTFRFRWEEGRLRFYDNGVWRFDVADPRRNSMAWISRDLGLWNGDEDPRPTSAGHAFADVVLGKS